MKGSWVWLLGVSLIFGMTTPCFADENELTALKEQVGKLNQRISQLESQAQRPSNVVPSGEATAGNAIEGALSGIRMTGFVDTAYHWNAANSPHQPDGAVLSGTAVNRNQSLGVFDTNSNSFDVHAVKLAFEKTAPEAGGVGFRTDILYGQDAKVIASGGTETDEFDFEQAYVEARLPIHALDGNKMLGNTVDIKAGKFVTLAGAEVIEAKDDWNTTRSILFGYAIPFTHTGIRAAYGLMDNKVTLTTGLNNGWDLLEDNNNYKTWEGQLAYKPSDTLLFTATSYLGPENNNQAGHKRQLYDVVALWNATKKLSLMANMDFGKETRVVGGPKPFDNGDWYGFAFYGRYQTTDKLAFASRIEYFLDDDVFRVGGGALQNPVDARERHYWEWTYTGEYKVYTNLISRLEYRYDSSDAPIFDANSHQSSVSAQLIYSFA